MQHADKFGRVGLKPDVSCDEFERHVSTLFTRQWDLTTLTAVFEIRSAFAGGVFEQTLPQGISVIDDQGNAKARTAAIAASLQHDQWWFDHCPPRQYSPSLPWKRFCGIQAAVEPVLVPERPGWENNMI